MVLSGSMRCVQDNDASYLPSSMLGLHNSVEVG